MAIMFLDPKEVEEIRGRYVTNGGNCDPRFTEFWDGVEVVSPIPNNEHQELVLNLMVPLYDTVRTTGLGRVFPGVNVSDRAGQWEHNYRGPDVVVYLDTNPAVDHGTHWQGGPDFLIEIASPGEDPRAKFDFYAKVKTREALIVNRDPWSIELHRLRGKKFVLVGTSELPKSAVLKSHVVPLTFRLVPGKKRPSIEVVHPATGKRWAA